MFILDHVKNDWHAFNYFKTVSIKMIESLKFTKAADQRDIEVLFKQTGDFL